VGPGSVEVIARATGAGIEISVVDSGLGLPHDHDSSGSTDTGNSSYGLRHVRERLQAVYGAKASLTLQARAPSGVSAVVSIPA
jgi:sensor histidine kinase YesM